MTACPEPDRENLVAVFKAMGMEEHPGAIGAWPGVRVDQSGHVKTLDLYPRHLRERPVPVPVVPELARLSKLQALRLRGSGELPPELGRLSDLKYLDIQAGELTGKIPPELGDLSNLTHLRFSSNKLSGGIPAELGKLSNLVSLHLRSNQLSGEIPAELGQLSNLTHASLDGNSLTGCLPTNWPVWSESLPVCSAASGRISQEQADQEFRALAALFEDAGGPEWGSRYRKHWLSDQPLGEWGGVRTDDNGYVVSLVLYSELKGSLPAELGNLTYLRTLDLRGSRTGGSLTGGIPEELGNLSHLISLTIRGLQEAGSIPLELFNLSNLRSLDLPRNQLTGEIPRELGNLSKLRRLHLDDNQLSGTIPMELGNLTEMQDLLLSGNQLTGEVPRAVWDLPKLYHVDLSREHGCIPAKLKDRLYTVFGAYSESRFC